MPLSSKNLALFYHHLSRSLETGLSLPAAIEGAPGLSKEQSTDLSRRFYSGEEPGRVIRDSTALFPAYDRELLEAGTRTARVPELLTTMAEYHDLRVKTSNMVVGILIYPMILLHMAALVMPALSNISLTEGGYQGTLVTYFEEVFALIGWIWAGLGLFWVFFSLEAPILRPIKSLIPGVGRFMKYNALSRLSFALSAFMDAGINMATSWGRAGALTQDPKLIQASNHIAQSIEAGELPSEEMQQFSVFPKEFSAVYKTGENTGSLVEALERQAVRYAETARNALKILGVILPVGIMVLVASLIGYQVISFYAGYFNQLQSIGG